MRLVRCVKAKTAPRHKHFLSVESVGTPMSARPSPTHPRRHGGRWPRRCCTSPPANPAGSPVELSVWLSNDAIRMEQAQELVLGVAVGHAGDVIADDALRRMAVDAAGVARR